MKNFEEGLFGKIGADDCHKVGIMGGCGVNCWIYQKGECEIADEIAEVKGEE